eukprot:scaffold182068_cov18-Tisochrysis_lutea.AAC.2
MNMQNWPAGRQNWTRQKQCVMHGCGIRKPWQRVERRPFLVHHSHWHFFLFLHALRQPWVCSGSTTQCTCTAQCVHHMGLLGGNA